MSESLTPRVLRDWPLPVPDGGKHARGSVLVVGGARATVGAVLLSGVAALRAGAGVLRMAVAESGAAALGVAVPEASVVGLSEKGSTIAGAAAAAALAGAVGQADVVLVGPGLDDVDETVTLLRGTVEAMGEDTALVLDAYALGALARVPDLGTRAAVLTPNAREGAILLGHEPSDLAAGAARIARRYGAVTSLYGHVATPAGRRWREDGGDTGLGTSGSGDVLAGVVAGLLARGAEPEQAACWATYTHAAAGQRLAARVGRIGFLARDLVDEVPRVLMELAS
jgi:ADP-dependent NAD(P)H-hydrate dehydratase